MNRIVLIAVFKTLQILAREKDYDGMTELIKTVLNEAKGE